MARQALTKEQFRAQFTQRVKCDGFIPEFMEMAHGYGIYTYLGKLFLLDGDAFYVR